MTIEGVTLIARGVMRSSHAKDNKHNYEIVTRVNSTRILCIVRCSTKKTYIEEVEKTYYFCYSGLNAVAATWAKKCHHSIFLVPLGTHPEIKLPVNGEIMNFTEQKSGLDPLLDSLKYAYNEYFDKFDWIFKANDDTFAVIENLRNLLLQYNTAEPLLIGGQSVHYVTPKRRAAGTSYAISKEALKRFVLEAVPDPFCSTSTLPEDIALTACLLSVGVETVNTRDDRGQKKFYPELQSRLYELGQDLVPKRAKNVRNPSYQELFRGGKNEPDAVPPPTTRALGRKLAGAPQL
ncbi:unnamed protein product, partial [Nesidiocoris tenuis]